LPGNFLRERAADYRSLRGQRAIAFVIAIAAPLFESPIVSGARVVPSRFHPRRLDFATARAFLQEMRSASLLIARAATGRAEVKKTNWKSTCRSATANQDFAEMCGKVHNFAPLCDNVQTPQENTVTIFGQGR